MYKNEYLDNCIKNKTGNVFILRGYKYWSKELESDKLVLDYLGFIYDHKEKLEDFKKELVKANIKEFILTESSSGLMDCLHGLHEVGIKIQKPIKVKMSNMYLSVEETKTKSGLLMIVE